MPINGIQSVVYGVDDVPTCTRYLIDFGLSLEESSAGHAVFRLEQGSSVVVRRRDDPALPPPWCEGNGMQEMILGVDTAKALETLVEGIARDREVRRDPDGTAHFTGPDKMGIGLRLYPKKRVISAPDPINSPDNVNRLNQNRKWRRDARPKTLNHVGWFSDDFIAAFDFFRDRLGMRYTDHSRGGALMLRGDGTNDHHNVFVLNVHNPVWHQSTLAFHHTAFGVEDVDEVMIGANNMQRRGWGGLDASMAGLGRHRISSALFWYHKAPLGGECEYQTDYDYVDDSWIPRVWEPNFGYTMWTTKVAPFQMGEPSWDFALDPDGKSIDEFRQKKPLAAE